MKTKSFFISSFLFTGSLIFLLMSTTCPAQEKPWIVPKKFEKMENPYLNAKDDDNLGRILYTKHCKSCHGKTGRGDGTKASSVDTPVPDFAKSGFKKETDGSLYYKSIFGRDDMPSFEKKITGEEDRWLLINYMKTLVE
ncbi:c-type cytochrome [Aestuariivivens sediminicola]|uniref:c-type cytochrome n=1 Tax=Aestuariivivens sediminicola TaxID=2913560 RepID=UPI001F570C27|nr:cytochrome c [Aestuariivivens sediminicola]